MHTGHRDRVDRRREPGLAVVDDRDRRRLVRAIDRKFLGYVVGVRTAQPRRADEDHRLGREVDVLLVFRDVAGDRLVAELGQLDPDLLRRHAVHTVADHRPRPAGQRVALRGEADRLAAPEQLDHRIRKIAQRRQAFVAVFPGRVVVETERGRDREREQEARRDLRIKGLGRRDAHLDVATIGGVKHTVGFVDEVAVAPVHDRHHLRAA